MPVRKKNIQRKSTRREEKSPTSLAEEVAALRKEISTLRTQTSSSPKQTRRRSARSSRSSEAKLTQQAHSPAAKPWQPVSSSSLPIYEIREARPTAFGGDFTTRGQITSETAEDVFFGGLLDLARINWLTGCWENLAEIDLQQIESHPDRARLALFGAVGWLSKKDLSRARTYMQAAIRYGCPTQLISRVLLSGVHASLAVTYGLAGRGRLSLKHSNSQQQIMPLGRLATFGRPALPRLENFDAGPFATTDFTLSPRLRAVAVSAVSSENPTEAVAQTLRSADLTKRERFFFLREVATQFAKAGNIMVASGFLEEASHFLDDLPTNYRNYIVKDLLGAGLREDAFEVALRGVGAHESFTHEEREHLSKAREALRNKILNVRGHGQEVLLAFLSAKSDALRRAKGDKTPTLIEIGTTRESTSGQGSTRRLMDFCRINGFHFITVDMDSANSQMAAQMFRESGVSFEAVHARGEDFLASYHGDMDCIFLDAYDFDHGKHSELRQSRYEKFLGTRISDADCHKMHLDCATAIVTKLRPWTVVCLDDTWLEAGRWMAKGTLAMPYLLQQGLQLLDIRNRSALLGAEAWFRDSAC